MRFRRLSLKLSLTAVSLALLVGCAAGGGGGDDSSSQSSGSTSDGGITSLGAFCATADPDQATLEKLSAGFTEFVSAGGANRTLQSSLSKDLIADIPVIFHVISKGPNVEDGEVSDQSLMDQIDVLNSAYTGGTTGIGTPFRFHLAGIDRVRKPEWHVMNPGSQSELDAKKALHSGDAGTLNIYLVTTEGGILGYTTLPVAVSLLGVYDGMVMNFRSLPGGAQERYNTGKVAVHEAGHWLGLLHTFEGECDNPLGDLIPDTPAEKIPGKGDACPVSRDSCPDSPGMDPIHNHMTYTVDSCRSEFTPDQVNFMVFNSGIFRQLPVF